MRLLAGFLLAVVPTAADDGFNLRPGRWTVQYEIVDVSSDLLPGAEAYVGHRWGGDNCLAADAPSAAIVLEAVAYHCEVASFSTERGRLLATRICNGGHAIPGRGTETIVASIRDGRLVGVSDVTLISDPNAGLTRIRSVITAERTGECTLSQMGL